MRTFFTSIPLGIVFILNVSSPRLSAQNNPSAPETLPIVLLDGQMQRQILRVENPRQTVRLQHLTPGETYVLTVPNDPATGLCAPELSMMMPGGGEMLHYNASLNQLKFVAGAETMDFLFEYACSWDRSNPPTHYLSLQCLSCRSQQNLGEFLRSSANIFPLNDLMTTPNGNPHSLIRDVLIGGNCFDISNVQYHGQPAQIGTFSNGQTNIGLSEGVVMATGNVLVATGPNSTDNADMGYGNYTPDAELSELSAGGDCFDMAFLEFDFRPTQTSVQFDFVFASEEYCEYVGTPFNDVFGFFISGPGINGPFNGAENIALVPSTSTYVAINNVNHLLHSGYFINNTPVTGLLCGQTGVTLPTITQTQFDGYTKKITVRATLETCQTYHIKLKVSDVADGIFDSAVFLRAGSFNAGTTASMHWVVDGQENATEAYENCSEASLLVRRVGGNPGQPLTVNYTVSGTATSGADFTGIPASVTIPAGQQQVIVPVNILADALVETPETIEIMPATLCNCSRPEEVLTILDVQPIQTVGDSISICEEGQATVGVQVQGGAGPYTYQWANGETTPAFSTFVPATQTYQVTVTDNCQVSQVATALVEVEAPVTAELQSPAPQLCFGQADSLTILFQGAGPYTLHYTLDGDPQIPIENILTNPFRLQVTQPGIYALTGVSSGACEGTATGSLEVTETFIQVNSTETDIRCAGEHNGAIVPVPQGGQMPYTYTWSGPSGTPANASSLSGLPPGNYQLTVSDALGCRAMEQFTISEPPPLTATIANIQGTNCDNPSEGSVDLDMNGGTPGYSYSWSNSATQQDAQNLVAGTYTVTVTDLSGCTVTTTAEVAGDFAAPVATAQMTGPFTCTASTVQISGIGSSTGPAFVYEWAASGGGNIFSGGNTLQPVVNAPGTYTLFVRNSENGCESSASIEQTSIVDYPESEAGDGPVLTCAVQQASLDGTGSSTGAQFTYQWTAQGNGTVVSGANSLQPVIGAPGIYSLQVTDQNNGCVSTDFVEITENLEAPEALIALPDTFSCQVSSIQLTGTVFPSTGVTYQWITIDGSVQSGQNSEEAQVSEPGLYTLIATLDLTGCADSASVAVVQNFAEPLAMVVPDDELDCSTASITLNGETSVLSVNTTFSWSASNGGQFDSGTNTLTPVISSPGTYTLLLTDQTSNCASSATVVIEDHSVLPPAEAGPMAMLTCNVDSLILGGVNANPVYSYTWTAGNGGNIVSGENTAAPVVNAPGTYLLSVLNPQNGCVAFDSVTVLQDQQAPVAMADHSDVLDCVTTTVQLSGAGSSSGPNFSYQWTSSTGNGIVSGAHTLTPVVAAAATYMLVVTNETSGCQSTATTVLAANDDAPQVTAVPLGTLSCVNHNVLLDGAGSAAGPGIFYLWSSTAGPILSGQGTLQATVGAAGLYTLQVSNTNNACTASYTIEVEQDMTAPVADAGAGQMLICTTPSITLDGNGSSAGTGILYEWTALSGGNFISPVNIPNPVVNEAGIYQIQVTDISNGCTSVDQVEIGSDPNDPEVQIVAPGVLNCTIHQIILDASASSSGSNFSYQWTGPGGILSGDTSLQLQVSAAGDYLLQITNTSNGCTSSQTASVVLDTLSPPAVAGPDNVLNCVVLQRQIGDPSAPVLPHISYTWTGPGILSGENTAAAVVDSAGIYNVLVVNNMNGCTATDAVQIDQDIAPPQADAGDTFELNCTVGTYTLNAQASQGSQFVYQWSTDTGNFLTAPDTLQPVVDGGGNYFLTVTNTQNGCSATDSVLIEASEDAPVSVISDPGTLTCVAATVTLQAGNSSAGSNYQYEWMALNGGHIQNGTDPQAPVVDAPGLYLLQITDISNNCIATDSVIVQQNIEYPDISIHTPPVITCAHPVASLQCSVTPPGIFGYQWTPENGGFIVSGGFTNHPLVSSAGTYVVYVANLENGCISTDSIGVAEDQEEPEANLPTPDPLTCLDPQVVLELNSPVTTLTYAWTAIVGHFVEPPESAQAVVDTAGLYEVIATNTVNGCSTVEIVQVTDDKILPVAEAGTGGEITCSVVTLELNGNGSSTGSAYTYQWTTQNGQIQSGSQSLHPVITSGGTYQLLVTNQNTGCQNTDMIVIQVDTFAPTAVILTPSALTCQQSQVTVQSNLGAGNFLYEWSTDNGNIVSGQHSANLVVDASGMYQLVATSFENGCSDTASTQVNAQIVLPEADAGPSLKLTCTVEEVTLQATADTGPGLTFSWSTQDGHIISGANTLQPLVGEAGWYVLTVLDANTGCRKTDTVQVAIETNVPVGFEVQVENPSCKNLDGIILFTHINGGVGPFTYSIDEGDTFDSVPEFDGLTAGTYVLKIRDANGCEWSRTLVVPSNPLPNISVIPEIHLKLGDSTSLQAQVQSYPLALIDTVIWSPTIGLSFEGNSILDLLNPIVKPFKSTEYTVTLISVDGCSASDRVLVTVDDEPNIYIPNAFSPWNNDNKNDEVFVLANSGQVTRIRRFSIYDRWGELVYQAENFQPNDPTFGWDGRYRGKMMNPGVFVYEAEVDIIDGSVVVKRGDVTLVR